MKNKNNITELVFIIDRSGSMSGLEEDTIGGFNSTLEKQKAESEAREKVAKIEIRRLTMWLDFFERRSRRKT